MKRDSSTEDGNCSVATAAPETRDANGTYIPPTVPPEWEAYSSRLLIDTDFE